jgi:hypothetical protein
MLFGHRQIADDPMDDPQPVDADGLSGSEALTPREFEPALEPGSRDVGENRAPDG